MDLNALYDRARDLLTDEATGDLFDAEKKLCLQPLMEKVYLNYPIPCGSAAEVVSLERRRDRTAQMAILVGTVFGAKAGRDSSAGYPLLEGQKLSARRSLLFTLIWAYQERERPEELVALNHLTKNILRWVLTEGDLQNSQAPEHIVIRNDDNIVPIGPDDFESTYQAV